MTGAKRHALQRPARPLRLSVRQQAGLDAAALAAVTLVVWGWGLPASWGWGLAFLLWAGKVAAVRTAGGHTVPWSDVSFLAFRKVAVSMLTFAGFSLIGLWWVPASWTQLAPLATADAGLSLLLLLGIRGAVRSRNEGSGMESERARHKSDRAPTRVLLIGAGRVGMLFARDVRLHPAWGFEVVGFLDDDPRLRGAWVEDRPVVGSLAALADVVAAYGVDEVAVTISAPPPRLIPSVAQALNGVAWPVRVRRVPSHGAWLSGSGPDLPVRDVNAADLLARPEVRLDEAGLRRAFAGKRVLVTGAGGSIGSELVCQLAPFAPAQVLGVGRGEASLFEVQRKVARSELAGRFDVALGDVRSRSRMRVLFERFQPDVVLHAAAHKHVPFMENDPEEAVLVNVAGTRNLLLLAAELGVQTFVNVSTDKAVAPSSVMGASKRLAELWVARTAADVGPGRSFVSVRFGNVLGSRGSAVPLFQQQIRDGGPVTVTHPDMTRYFMTIPEAAKLVLQAGALGGSGRVFVLDMGEPVKIVDLVRSLIRLSGLRPDVDVPIIISGVRPGEKMHEVLCNEQEPAHPSGHAGMTVVRPQTPDGGQLLAWTQRLADAAEAGDADGVRQSIKAALLDLEAKPDGATADVQAGVRSNTASSAGAPTRTGM